VIRNDPDLSRAGCRLVQVKTDVHTIHPVHRPRLVTEIGGDDALGGVQSGRQRNQQKREQ
jgi:hypothetical protein